MAPCTSRTGRWSSRGSLISRPASWGGSRACGEAHREALRRRGLLPVEQDGADPIGEGDPEGKLAASAVSGQTPPAGPQWRSGLFPLESQPLAYDKPLCASLDGFTLHAATRAGGLDPTGREARLRYVLRPPLAQERVEPRKDGLVRVT